MAVIATIPNGIQYFSINNNLNDIRKMERNDALRVFTNDSGFVMIDRKLQEVKWLQTKFQFHHKDGDFLFYTAVTTFKKPDGTVDALDDYDKAFDSVEKYENGVSAETSYKTLCTQKNGGDVVNNILHGVKCSSLPVYWIFDKHCQAPVEYKLEYEEFVYDYSDNRFHTDEFPKDCEIYDTKEKALSYNTYKVIEKDGTEYEREGINKLIMLDDDQRELVVQFEQLCAKMKKANLIMIADYTTLSVFNLRRVENFALDYNEEPDVDFGDPKDYEKADRYGDAFVVTSNIEFWGDDHYLFIQRKDAKNDK